MGLRDEGRVSGFSEAFGTENRHGRSLYIARAVALIYTLSKPKIPIRNASSTTSDTSMLLPLVTSKP
jgi:hypothetical protein